MLNYAIAKITLFQSLLISKFNKKIYLVCKRLRNVFLECSVYNYDIVEIQVSSVYYNDTFDNQIHDLSIFKVVNDLSKWR